MLRILLTSLLVTGMALVVDDPNGAMGYVLLASYAAGASARAWSKPVRDHIPGAVIGLIGCGWLWWLGAHSLSWCLVAAGLAPLLVSMAGSAVRAKRSPSP